MEDILKAEITATSKNFWYNVGAKIQKRVKGIVQVFYNKFNNSIVIRIFFEKFNYSINTEFRVYNSMKETDIVNMVLNSIKFNIFEEIFE